MIDIISMLDLTILKTDATEKDVVKLCEDAKENGCAAVCVNPFFVSLAKWLLEGSDVKVCTVVGFPLGASTKEVKAFEAKQAIKDGAQEIDMVLNVGALKNKNYDIVGKDIEAVAKVCKNKAVLKVIIETCLLDDEEKKIASQIVVQAGGQYVKTSTGFSTGGATAEDVKLIRKTVGSDAKIKASGKVRDYETAIAMIEAGADRIGSSSLIRK